MTECDAIAGQAALPTSKQANPEASSSLLVSRSRLFIAGDGASPFRNIAIAALFSLVAIGIWFRFRGGDFVFTGDLVLTRPH